MKSEMPPIIIVTNTANLVLIVARLIRLNNPVINPTFQPA